MTRPIDLIVTFVVVTFLAIVVLLWIHNEEQMPLKQAIMKKYRALIRTQKTKVPRLCSKHAVELLVTKGKGRMAILDTPNCEICNKNARVV
jgi:hypothetical protein